MDTSVTEVESASSQASKGQRSVALDTFRGITILLMLFVNNIMVANVSPAIAHGEWSGSLGLADLVFPWFLMAVGIALSFSWKKFESKGSYRAFVVKAAKRTLALLLLGMLVDSAVNKQITLGLGVLQIIGIAFLVGALAVKAPAWAKATLGICLLIGYGLFLHAGSDFSAEANATRSINAFLTPFGLRGLISALPTGAAVLLAAALGDLWISHPKRQVASAAVFGLVLSIVGWIWSQYTPALKPIWTPSFICLTLGLGGLMLALLTLMDSNVFRLITSPIRAAGTNPILAYVAPIAVKVMILQVWRLPGTSDSIEKSGLAALSTRYGMQAGPWVYTGVLILVWWLVLIFLDYKKIILKV